MAGTGKVARVGGRLATGLILSSKVLGSQVGGDEGKSQEHWATPGMWKERQVPLTVPPSVHPCTWAIKEPLNLNPISTPLPCISEVHSGPGRKGAAASLLPT